MKLSKKAVIVVGHGSKRKGFEAAMVRVAAKLRRGGKFGAVSCAYLGSASPSVPGAIARCVRRGAAEIVIVPYFVLAGDHVAEDIPEMVREAVKRYRGKAKIRLSPYLGYHAKIVSVIQERIRQAR
ncbi:MAG: sirohydrochlorin chelatase [Candidatus Omnitrophota bacterium]